MSPVLKRFVLFSYQLTIKKKLRNSCAKNKEEKNYFAILSSFQSSVAWTSQIFRWLYSDLVIVNDLLQSWVQTLNEFMKKNAEEVSGRIDFI